MRKLIMIRHAPTAVNPDVPPEKWALSEEGERRAAQLAEVLAVHRPGVIVTSQQTKAVDTGRIAAGRLGIPCKAADGLHEQRRDDDVYLCEHEFRARLETFFTRSDHHIPGDETADEVHRRFSNAVVNVLDRYPGQNVGIVSHGRALAVYLSRLLQVDPLPLWERLGFPAVVVLSMPRYDLVDMIEEVT
jgi:broad specificity phosphatase PhoE